MSIKHAILGFLSWHPLTGYELKKLFAGSPVLAWSGNSNQIYKTLVELHSEGLVTLETVPQPDRPPRKIYTITEQGLAELKSWTLAAPPPPEQKNNFLNQLAWSGQLDNAAIAGLLQKYEETLRTQLLVFQARDARKATPDRTPRETYLWQKISENWLSFYNSQLEWAARLRAELDNFKE